jgi:uncharacterized protein DUF748
MAEDQSGSAAQPHSMRRLYFNFLAAAALLALAAAYFFLPVLVRPLIERTLADRVHEPVHIARLSWHPFVGEVIAEGIAVGADGGRLSAGRLSVDIALGRLLHQEIVFDQLVLDRPVTTIEFDEHYRPALAGSTSNTGAGGATAPLLPLTVHRLIVSRGDITVRLPLQRRTRDAKLEIARLTASEIVWTPSDRGLSLEGDLDARLDGAPVKGEGSLKLSSSQRRIEVHLDASGVRVSRDTFALPAALRTFTGRLDLHAAFESSAAAARDLLRLDVKADEPSLEGEQGTQLTAKSVTLPEVRIDLANRRIDLGPIRLQSPVVGIALTEAGVILPFAGERQGPASGGSSWILRSGAVEVRDGDILATRGNTSVALAIPSARWEGPGETPGALTVRGRTEGGTIAIDGTLGVWPLAAELDVELDKLPLPPLAHLSAALPVELAKGSGGGTLHVHYAEGGWRLDGEAYVDDLQTAPPRADRTAEVMAVHNARAKFSLHPGASPWLDVALLQLSYPYVMVERTHAGIFPYSLLTATGEARQDSSHGERQSTSVRLRRVEVDAGKVDFLDDTFTPSYWTALSTLKAQVDGVVFPQLIVDHFDANGRHDEISPAQISGSVTALGLEAGAKVDGLLLESLNPFVTDILGYKATSGQLSLVARSKPEPPLLHATANIDLSRVGVEQTGVDFIQRESGVPFPIALGLIKGPSGNIELRLQAAVDTQSRSLSLGSIVGQAIRSAIVGALTSPLRLLGSLFGLNGSPHAFAIDPIPFAAGSGSLDDAGRQRVAEIARILQSHDSLLLITLPQIAAADFDAVGAAGAPSLAQQRNATVLQALTSPATGASLASDRIVPAEWTVATDATATGKPGVYVELQAR